MTNNNRTADGLIRVSTYVDESAEPVLPIAPTIIGNEDPYNSEVPVIRARVAQVVEPDPEAEEKPEGEEDAEAVALDGNGIPVARPVLVPDEDEVLPDQRVELPRPRAIVID